ncbi:isocitrate lyase/phosphoenolpyruvate mutase family protein [Roseomonas sp. 573]|uniref:Isocitrate lyase/phosphoenolpyruvate mutase family protein n=1 Tax=Roseomonas haemaphysalidis TaxID=2768162 RepID=A0ABS3KKM7_9PROT|nr:isocitrate lyase/phosphoenolpyruvate mutase family protein [Roseomonas haemaphysalidis]MBO1078011.1 isocitrate lyase/phosphoenolpyruvate mutase family protein [Roseomonas haemaphysalidis]
MLDAPEILVLPGVQDALSARLAAQHGFGAVVAGGNAATGTLLGAADLGQLGLRDFADHYGRIAAATDLPVLVDADTGFGGPHNVARMVRAFEQAGIAGFFMEDQVTPKRCGYLSGKAVVPVREQLGKLAAALDARRDPALVICARTDALGVEGLDAALERAALFREAGADMVFVQGADDSATLRAACAAVPGPHLANVSQASGRPGLSAAECQAAGAAAVMFPMAALLAALQAMDRLFATLRQTGRVQAGGDALLPFARYNALTGLDALVAAEDAYAARAEAVQARRAGGEP